MTNELVSVTDANPFKAFRQENGRWSMRRCQGARLGLHTEYRRTKEAIERGRKLITTMLGVSAAQDSFVDVAKSVPNPSGGKPRIIPDYDTEVTALGLFAVLQKSDLPDVDIWFVFAGMEKAGVSPLPSQFVSRNIGATRLTMRQIGTLAKNLAPLAPKVQYLVMRMAMQGEPAPVPAPQNVFNVVSFGLAIEELNRVVTAGKEELWKEAFAIKPQLRPTPLPGLFVPPAGDGTRHAASQPGRGGDGNPSAE